MARGEITSSSAETATPGAFVGRRRDREELLVTLDATASGRGSLVLISGEPGIGKTRLAQELATQASSRGMDVAWGTGWEGEGAPSYWPWLQVIRSIARTSPDAIRELGQAAADIARIAPDVAERAGPRLRAPSLAPENERFRLFDAVGSLLEAAGRARPLVVILDDLHEADEPSVKLLAFVASRLPASRLLVLATHRHVGAEHRLAAVLAGLRRDARRLRLRGLTHTDP